MLSDPAEDAPRKGRAARLEAHRGGPGSGLTDPTEPQFSQPVRQVVLMLAVLVLVVTGAWFAYARILPIFAANPLLNGAILVVFGLGVLTCFWQVGQLMRSVSWIERYAAGRFGYGPGDRPAPDVAPRLLAPLANMLGLRGPLAGVISTEQARSIQDSVATRIDEARDITRYLANLLIFLGLLGTFYGLATTVPAIVETIRTLAPDQGESGVDVFDKLMHGLETQLGGMATAFSSSLLGLAGSLVVGLLELFASHGQNRFYRELEEWLSGFTRVGIASGEGGLDAGALAEFVQGIGARMAALQDYYAERDLLRDEEASEADARSLALADQVSRLVDLLGVDRDRLTSHLVEEGRVHGEAQRQLVAGIERIAAGLAARDDAPVLTALERLAQGQERAPQSDPAMLAALDRVAQGQEHLAAQARTPVTLPEEFTLALARITEGQNRLALMADQPQGDGAQIAALNRGLGRLAEGQARLVELAESRPEVRPMGAAPAAQDDPEARMRLRSIDVQLGRLVEESAASRDGLISELREDLAALTRAIRALEARHGA
ncbi:MAG: hypothetical protein QM682_06075 [Paracoccus sp. (in: a-proteobacteria)]